MSESNLFSERLREPLNETTRKVRRNLMAASVIGVVITKVGLVPSKISAFGVEFTSANQQALMMLLTIAILYFAINFMIYFFSELSAWQIAISSKEIRKLEAESKRLKATNYSDREGGEFREYDQQLYIITKPAFYIRLFIELVVPIVFAIYSFSALLNMEVAIKETSISTEQEPANKALQPTPKNGTAEL